MRFKQNKPPHLAKPPRLASLILELITLGDGEFHLKNEFEEEFRDRALANGIFRAKLWYWFQMLRSMPFLMNETIFRSMGMFKTNIKIAYRQILRHKMESAINITGLSVGLACSVLILLWVLNEISFDKFHKNADNIYRVALNAHFGNSDLHIPKACPPFAEALRKEYPEVLQSTLLFPVSRASVECNNVQYFENGILYADNSFFKLFTFPLIAGSQENALKNPNTAVISEEMAFKYFGKENPVGKTLRLNNSSDYTVTGVLRKIPGNSHLKFNMLLSMETMIVSGRAGIKSWTNLNYYMYLLLKENTDHTVLESKFPKLVGSYLGEVLKRAGGSLEFYLQPLMDIYLFTNLEQDISENGNVKYVYIFSVVALIILLLACINFVNITTARLTARTKEIGMKKILGAEKTRLVIQIFSEILMFTAFSFITALIIVKLCLPYFNTISGKAFDINFYNVIRLVPLLTGLMLLTGLGIGIYPAFYVSKFHPVNAIKGITGRKMKNSWLRKLLVTAQFAISISLMAGSFVIFKQLDYMKGKDLGFDKEHVLVLSLNNNSLIGKMGVIQQELMSVDGVSDVSSSNMVPGQVSYMNPFIPEGYSSDEPIVFRQLNANPRYIPLYDIKLQSGRNFKKDNSTDISGSVIINEKAVEKIGWKEPVGKTISSIEASGRGWKKTVIGVVKDFHVSSLHKPIEPMIISYVPSRSSIISVKLRPGDLRSILGRLESKWKELNPGNPFDYFFLDESFDRQYAADERLSRIFSSFTFLAIFIACLGLLGMTSFLTQQRTKEIGIRKVLGSSTHGIVAMLYKDLTLTCLIATVIAWPASYLMMDIWLREFPYKTNVGILIFLFSSAGAFFTGFITMLYQSFKAASANPVDSINYE